MNIQETNSQIAGLIVAAGRSERMGRPKLNLAWGDTTVLGQVIRALAEGGVMRVFIVINPLRKPVIPDGLPDIEINWIENPAAETSEMLTSIQTGLSALPGDVQYALICLGDQPTIRPDVVQTMLNALHASGQKLVFPSYRFRRGHPWGVHREHWTEICVLSSTDTVRSFIQPHADSIHYVNFDMDPPEDMDTPEMYEHLKKVSGL